MKPAKKPLTIGWREWLALPGLGVERIKAKVDTGARTSALHALNVRPFDKAGEAWARFDLFPFQDDAKTTLAAEARLLGYRRVRSSNGKTERRPVITTEVELAGQRWPIELTLTRRDSMGFQMLLGRQALRKRLVVDVSRSFIAEKAATPAPRKVETKTRPAGRRAGTKGSVPEVQKGEP